MKPVTPGQRALGWLLVALGGLWVLLTGGCTLAFVGMIVSEALHGNASGGGLGALPGWLAIGAACVAPGGLSIWFGLKLARGAGERPSG